MFKLGKHKYIYTLIFILDCSLQNENVKPKVMIV